MAVSFQQGRVPLSRGSAGAQSLRTQPALLSRCTQRLPSVRKIHVLYNVRKGASARAAKDEGPALSPEVEDTLAEVSNTISRWTNAIQGKWEETPNSERPAAVAIVVGSVIAQIAIGATVDSIDKIPLFKQFFEVVGLSVTLYTAYKYAVEPTHRKSLKESISQFVSAVTGK